MLLCDHVRPDLAVHVGGDYDHLFTDFLTNASVAADVPIRLSFFDAVNGELPAATDECDAWVITGSRHDAYTDDEWIVNLREFVRGVNEHNGRIAGICFGHQLVATAFGGTVERTDNWSVGPQYLSLDATAWFESQTVYLHGMHRDVVTALPDGAKVAGQGETADVPAFQMGDNIFCVQDHPEFPTQYVKALIEARSDRIDAETATAALAAISERPTQGAAIGEAIIRFLADQRL